MEEYVDVLIIGAGLSGIAAAYYLQKECPAKSYLILEAREAMGGTWDLFRYPGIRSDSDMHTLGYSFRPWMGDNAITDGESIRNYINETAVTFSIDQHIRYQHHVVTVNWSSDEAQWTVEAAVGNERKLYKSHFLYMATGYYDYDKGYSPHWEGVEQYQGHLVHPQQWPEDLDYTAKNVIVIGSGATAVTLVPAMAVDANHVTMLQRTPTYIVSRPAKDGFANWLHSYLPSQFAHQLARWKSILLQMYFYHFAQRFPQTAKDAIIKDVKKELGDDEEIEKHFSPPYNPWDQRLCLVPDSDLFNVIKADKASIVTDTIKTFTTTGIELNSGEHLEADIIVCFLLLGLLSKLRAASRSVLMANNMIQPNYLAIKG